MLDIKYIRENPKKIKQALKNRERDRHRCSFVIGVKKKEKSWERLITKGRNKKKQ